MDKLRLEPTAALVMLWALSLYNEEPVLRFVRQLDVSSGYPLYNKCDAVCNWYSQVILNRKSFVRHLIEQKLLTTKWQYQLVFLAAGMSPLSIEILSTYSQKVHRIFEVDISGVEDKRRLYYKLFPKFRDKLKCINADIATTNILDILDSPDFGYRRDLPSIVLMEGISYYLSRQELKNILASFTVERGSIFIIEYLIPYQYVCQARRPIPKKVFKIIQEDCGLGEITSYTKDELRSLLRENGGDLIASYCMRDMELTRTGANTYFKKSSDGWIECVVGKIGTSKAT